MSFGGWCRFGPYGLGQRDWMKEITGTDALECQQHCKDNTGCTAFSHDAVGNCNLYKKGPYTHGAGNAGTTCYLMKGKPGYY